MSGIMMAPVEWLNEMAQWPVKTEWGEMMKAEYPPEETDKVYFRLKEEYGETYEWAIQGFVMMAPMLAEHEAIQAYKDAHPALLWQLNAIAPEILTPEEALMWAEANLQKRFTEEEKAVFLYLIRNDRTMRPLRSMRDGR